MAASAWLRGELETLRRRSGSALELDENLIDGLVSFCELADPADAADYLANILGVESGQEIIHGYLERRGHVNISSGADSAGTSNIQAYNKPQVDAAAKKQSKSQSIAAGAQDSKSQIKTAEQASSSKANVGNPRKKKGGKAISLSEAAKGSVVFQQGLPCNCQARRHKLVSNCLSCGKIVCEQEGEGPCQFCGALVLQEGSSYAGLSDGVIPPSESEAAAEAYAKRLVEYDRNSAARTKVIDDQFDYYEIEGNSWLSAKEKNVLKMKQEAAEEAANKDKGKVVVTFDLVGRKVILHNDQASDFALGNILQPVEQREMNRITPNPTAKVQAMFIANDKPAKEKQGKRLSTGLCLENTGRVQHESKDMRLFQQTVPNENSAQGRHPQVLEEDYECSADYN